MDYNTRTICTDKLKILFPKNKKVPLEIENSIYSYAYNKAIEHNITPEFEYKQFFKLYVEIARRILDNLDPNSYIKNNYLLNAVKR